MPEPIDTPFRAFVRQNKPIFEAENPDYEYHEIRDLCEEVWEVFDQEQKQYYEELAKEDKWRFIEEWEAWLRQRFGTPDPVEPSKWPQLPERPLSGYRIFCDQRKEHFMKLMPES